MKGWEARAMLKMKVESEFKECSDNLYQWPWVLEKE